MGSIKEQIRRVKKAGAETARSAPWLFPEYVEMVNSRNEAAQTMRRHKAARKRWRGILAGGLG